MPLVVCIGNELVADDAAGFEVHDCLSQILPPTVRIAYCAVSGLALLDLLDGSEDTLVVVDAVQLGAPVGFVHCLDTDQLPGSCAGAVSAHGIGLRDTLQIGLTLYPDLMPRHITLVGIEGRCFNLPRIHMSAAVVHAIPLAVQQVLCLLHLEGRSRAA